MRVLIFKTLQLLNKQDFLKSAYQIAICGIYYGNCTVHVGIAWKNLDDQQNLVFHFISANNIRLDDINLPIFDKYLFSPIEGFDIELLPSLHVLAKNIVAGSHIFAYNRAGAIYNGGKFYFNTGKYTVKNKCENIINCGVFVIAFLKTYDHDLIIWDTFPNADIQNLQANPYLNNWLNTNDIPIEHRDIFYKTSKVIRGKDILISASLEGNPIDFTTITSYYEKLFDTFKTI